MKCYYEVLNVPRDADIGDIKAAYKKLALKWHPDKNLANTDYAKEQFQFIQQAYEVLSDRQERAWYDNHREQILRGADSTYEDCSLDVYQYFTSSCYKGYGDDDDSFYSIYRCVFEKIAKEDLEFIENEEFCSIPSFGNSQSDYDEVVKPFYDYWTNYSTQKSFVWLDPHSIIEAPNRRTLKYMDKENKKVRQKARKERNEEVRALVAFVRKRDKRVQEYAKILEARKLENKQKYEKLKLQKQRERKEKIDNTMSQADWTKFDNVQSELREIERNLAEQFSEDLSDSNTESEELDENLYCVACNKIFKTPQTFKNHELSKKHKENVLVLKDSLLNEEQSDGVGKDYFSGISDEEINSNLEAISDEEVPKVSKKKKKKNRKPRKTIDIVLNEESGNADINEESDNSDINEESDNSDINEESGKKQTEVSSKSIVSDEDNADLLEKKKKIKKKTMKAKQFKNSEANGTSSIPNEKLLRNGTEQKISKSKAKAQKLAEEATQMDTNHNCVTCKANFSSKNKLFEHLKKTGHSVYLPQSIIKSKQKKKSVKEH